MSNLLSPGARRLLAILSIEPIQPGIVSADGAAVIAELGRFGLVTWGPAGLALTKAGMQAGERYDLRN